MHLDPRVVNLWRLSALLRFFLFWVPILVVAGGALYTVAGVPAVGALATLILLFNALQILLWPTLLWRSFTYELRDFDLLVESGVLFRQVISVPLSRIQHVDTRQGPVERLFGLSRLIVYTAAGMAADAALPGLDVETADSLRDTLSRRGGDDGV